jgi:Zn-finger nucleic acid-binding protein
VEIKREANVRYLECPTCAQLMHRKNFASCSGVIIDSCRGHGVWFDRHELEAILRFVADGGLDQAREKELRRQEAAAQHARARLDRAQMPVRAAGAGMVLGRHERTGSPLLDALGGFLGGLF